MLLDAITIVNKTQIWNFSTSSGKGYACRPNLTILQQLAVIKFNHGIFTL